MAPPVNNSFATATLISVFPYSFTQSDINDAGTNYTVYYRFIAPTNGIVVGAWGFTGNIGAGYRVTTFPYLGPAGAPTSVLGIASGLNRRIQFPVTAGNEYFLEFVKNSNTAGPEHLDINVQIHNELAVEAGDIIINDDTTGFPVAIMDPGIDNFVKAYVKDFAAGEAGDITTGGIMCMEDVGSQQIRFYSPAFAQFSSFSFAGLGTPRIRCCRGRSVFYIGYSNNPATVVVNRYASNGTQNPGTYSLTGSTTLQSLAADNSESILYYAVQGSNVPIKRWDLVTNLALADLVAGVVNEAIIDMFVLADGTILALYFNSGTKDVNLRRYSTGGGLLNTYTMGVQTSTTIPRAAYAADDPTSFWVFTHGSGATGNDTVRNVIVATGVVNITRTFKQFEGGAYQGPETATPSAAFGSSFSCPLMIMMSTQYPGIYIIDPTRTADRVNNRGVLLELAIPDPTYRTGPLG